MDVLMPQLGETVAEGKITKWFKSAGDAVKPGDNLFEIETDKVSMEVPSIAAGTLAEIRVQAGDVAPVGAVVAIIAGEGGAAASAPAAKAAASAPPSTASKPAPASPPVIPAQAGTQGQDWAPLSRGRRREALLTKTSIPSSRCARPRATSALPEPPAARPSRRSPAGSPARTASISSRLCRLRPARPHRRGRRREGDRQRRGTRRARDGDRRIGRAGPGKSWRSIRASSSRSCRSTACAAPSRRGWSRPSRPSRTSISPPT